MLQRYHGDTGGATFDLLPAIDLRGGRVVRLVQGDFGRETAYDDAPSSVAADFAKQGAMWLHVVDLDGARRGSPVQRAAIAAIVERAGPAVRVEAAGGLRTERDVDAAFGAGAARAVVGTAALRDPAFAGRLVRRHGADRIAAAIDVRDGLALGEGWRPGAAGLGVEEAVTRLAEAGVATFEVTAVARDGMLSGPDLELLRSVVGLGLGDVIASGGVGQIDDLRAIRETGCRGAIIGRALYEGRFSLREALEGIDG
ncbi:MAG TPA: 1-(5-phosphoribosyl)-5-[(5-phosphoribosylamino)methylideneamino] imidazole-4-carboxamide isomerase [Vitreimonas sp.]|nr:1-(5-phosphoribosyl)-5-[(5-phosphoribosylamino)methylideneamino] imidazole-4-carboxamide isomerase [Vitreimonas sp.]